MQNLKWISIPKYEGLYEINIIGQVRSLHKRNYHGIMPQRLDRAGYYTVRLSNKGKDSTQYVHRLLRFTFIPNPLNKPEINHIDGNKLNNSIENLEWVTHAENVKHAYQTGAIKRRKGKDHVRAVPVLFKPTGERFATISEAAKKDGKNYEAFRRRLRINKDKGYTRLDTMTDE